MTLTAHDADLLRLGELLDLAPVGVIVRAFGADTISYWSRGAEEMYGWSREEALGRVTHKLLRTHFPASKDEVDDALRSARHWEGELVHTVRSGEQVVVASRQAVHADEAGQPVAILEINTDITQGKRTQEGLRDSEDRFRLLVETIQDYAIFLLSPEGNVVSWNSGAQRVKGYLPDEIIGQHFSRFYEPEAAARGVPQSLLARAAAEGRAQAEGWRVRKDGTRFWADVVLTALRDEQGTLRGFAKVTRDLTERKQAEEARANASREEGARAASEAAQAELRASRDQLAAILAGVAEGITVQNANGLVFANDAAARLCGFPSAEEFLAVPPRQVLSRFDIFDESGAPLDADRLPGRQALYGRAVPELLVRFRVRATGEQRWSLVGATPVLDAQGRVQLAVTIFRDITERKLAEETARFMAAASAELARSLDFEYTFQRVAQLAVPTLADWCVIDVIEDGGQVRRLATAHMDPDKVRLAMELSERYPTEVAPAGMAQTLRMSRPELLSDVTDEQLQSGARDAEHLALLRSLQIRSVITVPLIARGRTLGVIALVAAESGRRYGAAELEVAKDLAVRAALAADNAWLYREAQQQAAIHVELNTALRDTMLQLEQSVLTRDEFLASASHDLKNPVASIKASAQLLQRRLKRAGQEFDRDQVLVGLDRIDRIATRAGNLVDELLDVARQQMGRPLDLDRQPTDLVALARECVAEHQQRTDRHELEFFAPFDELVGAWDARRLGRAFSNLLDNAIKYSPEGGTIRVRLEREDGPRDWAILSVQDQGIGIPGDELEQIFGRFQRGTNVVGEIAGTGLGLVSVRQTVENHGGTVTAISQPGQGATFTMRLPIQHE